MKLVGRVTSASRKMRYCPRAFLPPKFLWNETFLLGEANRENEGSRAANLRATGTVLSSELPSTTITSKSRSSWWVRDLRSLGRYRSSFKVGMITLKKGFLGGMDMEDLRVIITAQGKRGRLGFGGLVIILKRVKLKRVKLFDFRSYTKREFVFDEGTTVVVGENGAGKTNLLEGIYFLATGKSFRAGSDLEVIRHGQSLGRVIGELEDGGEGVELEVVVGDGSAGMGRKKFMVNGVGRRLIDFSARLKAVMFGPWDLELVDGSPGRRRDYLDRVLCLVDREYRRALGSYEKGIRQRNRLLIRIREGQAGRGQTLFWDKLVVKNGNYIPVLTHQF